MLYEEFKSLTQDSQSCLTGDQLLNQEPRSLLLGQTDERYRFHVYLDESGVIHRVIYDADGLLVNHKTESHGLTFQDCVPSLHAYPEKCDFEFCDHLMAHRAFLPFTMYSWLTKSTWYGLRIEQLNTELNASDLVVELTPDWTTYGLTLSYFNDAKQSVKWLTEAANKQLTGYLRSITLRNDPHAERWFDNIEVLLRVHCDNNYFNGIPVSFEHGLVKFCEDARAFCQEKAKAILETCAKPA